MSNKALAYEIKTTEANICRDLKIMEAHGWIEKSKTNSGKHSYGGETVYRRDAFLSRHDYVCGFCLWIRAHPRRAGTGLYAPIPQRQHLTLARFPKIIAQAVISNGRQ
jgi:hypothetical protein